MALQLNPDGTFSVTDDTTGAATLSNLPGEFAPPQARPMGTEAKIAGALGVAPPPTPGVTPVAQPPGVDPSQIVRPGSASPAPGAAPGAPAGGEPGSAAGSATQQALMSAIRGRPGVYVNRPETRQVVSEQIQTQQGAAPLSEDTRIAQDLARVRQGIAANERAQGALDIQEQAATDFVEQQTRADEQLERVKLQQANQRNQIAEHQRQTQELVAPRLAKLDQIGSEIRQSREAAEKYWADKKQGTSFLAGLGLLLSDFASGWVGKESPVRARIQREEEDELARQKAEIEALQAEAGDERSLLDFETARQNNLLAQMQSTFQSPEAAESATRAVLAERHAAKLRELSAREVGAEAAAHAAEVVAELEAKAAAHRAEAELREQDTVTVGQNVRVTPAIRGVVGGSRGGIEAAFALGKKIGLNAEQTMSLLDKGMLPGFAKGDLQRLKAENDLLEEQRRGAALRGEAPPAPKGENTQKVRGAAAVALQGIDRFKRLSEAEGFAPSKVLPGGLYQGAPALTSEAKALASTAAMIAEGGTAPNADVMRGLEQQLTHWDPEVRRAAVETVEKNIKAALVQAGGKAPVERGRPAP